MLQVWKENLELIHLMHTLAFPYLQDISGEEFVIFQALAVLILHLPFSQ